MYLDVKARLSNKFWARHLVDTVAMWLKCNSTPPFRVDSRQLLPWDYFRWPVIQDPATQGSERYRLIVTQTEDF
jgi:hypothetical protein